MNDHSSVTHPVLKVSTALAASGFAGLTLNEWASLSTIFAGSCAAIYSLLMISEWLWKKLIRPSLFGRDATNLQGSPTDKDSQ